jgi:hypothetical protein
MWAGREAPPPDAPEEDADDRTGPTPSSTCDLISSRLRRIASIFLLNLASCDFFRGGMMAFRSAQTCAVRVSTHGRLDFPKRPVPFLFAENGVDGRFVKEAD